MNRNKSSYNFLQPLLLGVAVAIGMFIGFKLNEKPENSLVYSSAREDGPPTGRVEEMIRFIEHKYVDKINSDLLITDAVEAVFSHLDPHSVYLTPDEVEEVSDQMEGNYAGLGVENFMIDDTVNVASVLPLSPASRSGLQPFDQILRIDGQPVAGVGLSHEEVRKKLRRPPGTRITLDIFRDKKKQVIPVVVDEISVRSVHSCILPDLNTAYIKIDQFSTATYREFMEAVESSFSDNKARHLVLDLRNNPGGYLPEATNILCQLFTEKDKLLLYTEGRNDKRNEYKTNGKQFFEIEKIVILINEESASASEIIAGAIQDWDRGLIVGRRSYGKGLVQEQYPLTNGGAIRLTVARYFTPSGRSIQRDYSDREMWERDFEKRVEKGEMFAPDTTSREEKSYATLQMKRKVTGGGGITPDVFVPLEEVYRDDNALYLLDMLPEFTFRYLRSHRNTVPATPEALALWTPDASIGNSLRQFIAKQQEYGCIPELAQVSDFYPEMKKNFGRWLFGDRFLPYLGPSGDPYLQEAARSLKKSSLFTVPSGK